MVAAGDGTVAFSLASPAAATGAKFAGEVVQPTGFVCLCFLLERISLFALPALASQLEHSGD